MAHHNRQVSMYLDHYHLKLMPFEMGPDPRFLWLGSQHKEAFTTLRNTILDSKGFIVITGEPGTGKSTLLNATAANFGNSIRFAKITDPTVDEIDFFNFVANGFAMGKSFTNKADFLKHFGELVKDALAQSQKMILAIDEAQRLTPQRLEQIRVFANLEMEGKKVVNCIFAGQSEFLGMVDGNQALAQQVFFRHHIEPLTQSETGEYVTHRLEVAGAMGSIFTAPALQEIFRLTEGIPRLINILCDQAMLGGYALNITTLGPELIKDSTDYTMMAAKAHTVPADKAQRKYSASPSAADGPPREYSRQSDIQPPGRKIRYGAAIALTVALGLAGYSYFNGNFPATFTGAETPAGPGRSDGQPADPPSLPVEISRLQAELLAAIEQKNLAGALLDTVAKEKSALTESAQEMKSVRDRANLLEAEALERNKKLSEMEGRLAEQEKILVLEKAEKDRLGTELSSRQKAIADLQTRQETARSTQHKLETDLENSRKENARLQETMAKSQAPSPVPAVKKSQPPPAPPDPAPDPTSIIDFVIKKKSQ